MIIFYINLLVIQTLSDSSSQTPHKRKNDSHFVNKRTLLTVYNKTDSEWRSQSQNGVSDTNTYGFALKTR